MVMWLEQSGNDLPLHPITCFIKIHNVLPLWYRLTHIVFKKRSRLMGVSDSTFLRSNNQFRLAYMTDISDSWRFTCVAVNVTEHKKSDNSSFAVSDQVATTSAIESVDGSNAVAPSEVETVHPTTAKDTSSVPVAASVAKPVPPIQPVGPVKRKKRGRPPVIQRQWLKTAQQDSKRRHAKLLDVCIGCIFLSDECYYKPPPIQLTPSGL